MINFSFHHIAASSPLFTTGTAHVRNTYFATTKSPHKLLKFHDLWKLNNAKYTKKLHPQKLVYAKTNLIKNQSHENKSQRKLIYWTLYCLMSTKR